MAKLFEPFQVKNLMLKNRLVMAPMCLFCAEEDGIATAFHVQHYASRAVGGVGLIVVEATGVESRGRISSADLGLYTEAQVEAHRQLVSSVHQMGGKVAVQLGHAGAKCGVEGVTPISASAERFSERYAVPTAMSQALIDETVAAFASAAERAEAAGYDAIEIHGAHGYLIHQFLSPVMNKRADLYGGSEENRLRFLKDVLNAVKIKWPAEKPILLRVSAEDYAEGGNCPEDIGAMVEKVKALGVDVVHVSSGGATPEPVPTFPGYQVPMASVVKACTGLPTIAGGLITTPEHAESVLARGEADLIYLGRALLRDPYFPHRAAHALKVADYKWPAPYARAVE